MIEKSKSFEDLIVAQGSVEECKYYLILSKDLNYGETIKLKSQIAEVSKLLEAYNNSLLNSINLSS